VFYKELEEGACEIVDGNMILLAGETRTVPHQAVQSIYRYLYRKLSKCYKAVVPRLSGRVALSALSALAQSIQSAFNWLHDARGPVSP